jgi:hypothetical protein
VPLTRHNFNPQRVRGVLAKRSHPSLPSVAANAALAISIAAL